MEYIWSIYIFQSTMSTEAVADLGRAQMEDGKNARQIICIREGWRG